MAGGNHQGSRNHCARRLATALLGGLLIAPGGACLSRAADDALENPPGANEDCSPGPDEKSIVVGTAAAVPDLADVAVATDRLGDDDLQPIANVSEYEPELAEGESEPQAPTPADEPEAVVVGTTGDAPASSGSPNRQTADEVGVDEEPESAAETRTARVKIEAASFNGVTPGLTTRSEVDVKWGKPAQGGPTDDEITYKLDHFPAIAVTFTGDLVDSIRIELAQPGKAEQLIAKLGLSGLRPSNTQDDGGTRSMKFPERGVSLNVEAASAASPTSADAQVREIVIRPIEAAAFLERAETSPPRDYGDRIADLETTLELDGKNVPARLLLAEIKLAIGEVTAAERLAAEAVQLAPRADQYRLAWARCLKYQARYDEAVEQTRLVLEGTTASQVVRAQALEQMGLLAALGSKEVQQQAVPLHNKAIELADQLATTDDPATRAAANQLLVGAHLAVAERVAVGDWQHKSKAVEQWLGRASGLSEQMIEGGEADVSLRLQVALAGLRAGGRLNPPVDPTPWIAEAEQAAADLEATVTDPLAAEELNWQVGMAYFYATEIQHRRGQAESALKYGDLAKARLAPLSEARGELPDTEFTIGRLYFQIGAVYAVHHQDHDLACQWYDRAVESLLKPVPLTPLAGPGHHGDALVSMGVSYWEIGARDRAFDLTKAGLELVEQGVDEGLLAAAALDVPQGNLAAMSRALGKDSEITPTEAEEEPTRVVRANRNSGKRTTQSPTGRRQSQVADGRSRSEASTARRR